MGTFLSSLSCNEIPQDRARRKRRQAHKACQRHENRERRRAREAGYYATMNGINLERSHSFEPWALPAAWPKEVHPSLRRKPVPETAYRAVLPVPRGGERVRVVGKTDRGEGGDEGLYTEEIHRGVPWVATSPSGSAREISRILGDTRIVNVAEMDFAKGKKG
ncbi:hypothetical protein BU23DRAFT_638709 [Bimuria novae-zelandiae CBS 107.79]|uniref:Uncharacterized protein n=1 Tax=Bimuria novae-zelandiae CBS 107.79 TaxID=1447943 RepID=A0A6A5V9H0_9PLEO|nr:hypothetical protein BU23DRAFT_638709 [Bimuria novae-zelandiae CBS 107.79]